MAKPKKKQTKTCKRNRRAHFRLKSRILATCEKCGTRVLPHRACAECGNYKGRSVLAKVMDRIVAPKKSEAPKTEKKADEVKEAAK